MKTIQLIKTVTLGGSPKLLLLLFGQELTPKISSPFTKFKRKNRYLGFYIRESRQKAMS
jgi:hypothetical protein